MVLSRFALLVLVSIAASFWTATFVASEDVAATSLDSVTQEYVDRQGRSLFRQGDQACTWIYLNNGLSAIERCGVVLEPAQQHNILILQSALERFILDNVPSRAETNRWLNNQRSISQRLLADIPERECHEKGKGVADMVELLRYLAAKPVVEHLLDSLSHPGDPFSGGCL
jgi:hypothetical protein